MQAETFSDLSYTSPTLWVAGVVSKPPSQVPEKWAKCSDPEAEPRAGAGPGGAAPRAQEHRGR